MDTLYHTVLDDVGLVYESDSIWKAYKAFLEKHPRGDEEEKVVEMMRSFFHSVIILPIRSSHFSSDLP